MSTLGEIKEALLSIASVQGKANDMIFEAVVDDLNEGTRGTIGVSVNGMHLSNVRLCATGDNAQGNMFIGPPLGSTVLCLDIAGDRRDVVVIMFSKVDTVTFFEGKHTIANADVMVKQLQNLSKRVDALYNAINKGVPGSADGGAALQKSMQGFIAGKTSEDWKDCQDNRITH